jgi:hypothetical protein
MTTRSYPAIARFAVAGLFGLAACSTGGDLPTTIESPTSARFHVGELTDAIPQLGRLKVCKHIDSNTPGIFSFIREQFGTPGPGYLSELFPDATLTLQPGQCRIVAEDNGGNLVAALLRITEVADNLVSVSGERIDREPNSEDSTFSALAGFANGGQVTVNSFHGVTVTFLNTLVVPPPPPQVCDFITFGRLVTEVNGQKVVISGNAGGNNADGSIKGEFHIEANGVDNHVADIDSYEPAGALLNLTNARIVKGTAKNGVPVELRLWDGGEPGKGTDRVWVKLGNTILIGGPLGQLIDQGNMQYHPNCRGPDDE